jgi:hypothetical protein
MRTTCVIGFDLSLTAPAAVALPLDWRPGDWKRVKSWLFKPTPPKGDDLRGQLERYDLIAEWAHGVVQEATGMPGAPGRYLADLAIESYAFSKNNAQASKLMELGGIVRLGLFRGMGIIPKTVSTSSARKLLLGNVPRSDPKIAVQLALYKAKAPKKWEENICDAMCVCNFQLSEAGGVALAVAPPKRARKKAPKRKS